MKFCKQLCRFEVCRILWVQKNRFFSLQKREFPYVLIEFGERKLDTFARNLALEGSLHFRAQGRRARSEKSRRAPHIGASHGAYALLRGPQDTKMPGIPPYQKRRLETCARQAARQARIGRGSRSCPLRSQWHARRPRRSCVRCRSTRRIRSRRFACLVPRGLRTPKPSRTSALCLWFRSRSGSPFGPRTPRSRGRNTASCP
jgi:hypothetical protein